MKAATSPFSDAHTKRKAYAVKRMNRAAQRLLQAETLGEEIRAGRWAVAWAIAAGATVPPRLRTRGSQRHEQEHAQGRATNADEDSATAALIGEAMKRQLRGYLGAPEIGDAVLERGSAMWNCLAAGRQARTVH